VPVHKVGGEGRTAFASLEAENRSFLDESIDPVLVNWEQEARDKLLRESEKEADSHLIVFNRAALLAADAKTTSEVLVSEVNNGLLTANEARAIQDRPETDKRKPSQTTNPKRRKAATSQKRTTRIESSVI
jgi:phage portal protein BeeE